MDHRKIYNHCNLNGSPAVYRVEIRDSWSAIHVMVISEPSRPIYNFGSWVMFSTRPELV